MVVNLPTSVYKITPNMSIRIKALDDNFIGKTVRLCCNNQTFQFTERESGIDFSKGKGDEVNLNVRVISYAHEEAFLAALKNLQKLLALSLVLFFFF